MRISKLTLDELHYFKTKWCKRMTDEPLCLEAACMFVLRSAPEKDIRELLAVMKEEDK